MGRTSSTFAAGASFFLLAAMGGYGCVGHDDGGSAFTPTAATADGGAADVTAPEATAPPPTALALDESFGDDGAVALNLGSEKPLVAASVRQPDGKLVVVGSNRFVAAGASPQGGDAMLLRFGADGQLDATFGASGKVLLPLGAGAYASGVALAPGGKLVVVGIVMPQAGVAGPSGFAATYGFVARFASDGALDATFGAGGIATFEQVTTAVSVAVQDDGRVVVGGATALASAGGPVLTLRRFDAAGALDATFGTGGLARIECCVTTGGFERIALDAAGRTVAAGYVQNGWVLARFTTAGAPDSAFGTAGTVKVTTPAFALQGNAVLTAEASSSLTIRRLLADGTPDTTFGTSGTTTLARVAGAARIAVASDGSIVVADGAVHHLAKDGAPDNAFTSATLPFVAPSLVLDADRSVFVGTSAEKVALARYTLAGASDATFGASGVASVATGASVDAATAMAESPDGAITILAGRSLIRFDKAGHVDTTFGASGVALETSLQAVDVATTSDGKLLVGGDGSLTRYGTSGARDLGYGNAGFAALGLPSSFVIKAIAVDSQDRAVVVGIRQQTSANDPPPRIVVTRMTAAGAVDTTFGTGGVLELPPSPALWWANPAVALEPDDRVDVGVYSDTYQRADVVRLADPSFVFDSNLPVSASDAVEQPFLALQSDGKLIVGDALRREPLLERFTPSGTLDPTFGKLGFVRGANTGLTSPWRGAVMADGRIAHAGTTLDDGHQRIVVHTYDGYGATIGTAEIPLSRGNDIPLAARRTRDGKLLLAGQTWTPAGGADVMLVRLK